MSSCTHLVPLIIGLVVRVDYHQWVGFGEYICIAKLLAGEVQLHAHAGAARQGGGRVGRHQTRLSSD